MIPQNRINEIAVEQVMLEDGKVYIDYYLPEWDECKMLTVPADKYEKHLNEIEALNWSFAVMQGNEYKTDVEGTMSLAEYFADVDFQQRNKDAVSYLQCNHVAHEELPDIAAAVKATFPNATTYPAPEVHEAHIAQLTTPIN